MNQETQRKKNTTDADEIDFTGALNKTLYHWPLYFFIIFLSLISGYFYLRYTKPVYSSTAKIFIQDERSKGKAGSLDDLSVLGNKVVENEMELIKSPLDTGKRYT